MHKLTAGKHILEWHAQDENGMTALMLAVENENMEVVDRLLFYNLDLSIVDNEGKSGQDYLDSLQ